MNAGAYGSDWSEILVRARVVTAEGAGWLTPAELGLSYRHSELRPRPGRRRGRVPARAAPAGRDQGDGRRADRAAQGDPADEQAHVRQRLQEPRPRARRGPDARGVRAEGPRDRRRADLAEARELHRERRRRDDRRRARADGRGAPPRARAVRRRARARGASSSARSSRRRRRKRRRGGETRHVAGGSRISEPLAPACARGKRCRFRFRAARAGDRLELSRLRSLRPLAPRRAADPARPALGLYAAARTTSAFAVDADRRRGRARPRSPPRCARRWRRRSARACSASTSTSSRRAPSSVPMVAGASFDRGVPAHARDRRRPGGAGRRAPPGVVVVARRRGRPRRRGARPRRAAGPAARLAEARRRRPCRRARSAGSQLRAVAAVAPLVERPLPVRGRLRRRDRDGADARAPLRARAPARRHAPTCAVKLEVARRVLPAARRLRAATSTSASRSVRSPARALNSQVEVETSDLDHALSFAIDSGRQGDVPCTRKGTSSPRCSTRASGRETSRRLLDERFLRQLPRGDQGRRRRRRRHERRQPHGRRGPRRRRVHRRQHRRAGAADGRRRREDPHRLEGDARPRRRRRSGGRATRPRRRAATS